jgi:hypothetical protein
MAQHEGEPETTEKLRWLLQKAVRTFGEQRLSELRSPAIAAWRMTMPALVPVRARRPLRPAQLPEPQLEAGAKGGRDHATSPGLRSEAHVASFALRAGISTFDLSRYMGTSLAMIEGHYGHLAREGREHAIKLLDAYRAARPLDVHAVDAGWTLSRPANATIDNGKAG